MNKPDVLLVDGSSYLFRAYHALPPLTTADGTPTGAAYGVMNMIRRLLKDYTPKYVAVVFDTKGKTFRHDMYKDYKANRPAMPEELAVQIKPLHEMIKASGIPLLMQSGVEADDIIGTLTKAAEKEGLNVLISTGDKDFAQLVNQHVMLVNTMSNKTYDTDGVKEKFGVPPEQILDYLALVGDTVDNVPGVHKCGPKTAVKWLNEYGSMQGVIDNADKVGGKIGEYLREAVPNLPLSYELVTIKCDVELDEKVTDLSQQTSDVEALKKLFKKMQFNTWLAELDHGANDHEESNYECITEQKQLDKWLKRLAKADEFAFDTETDSLDARSASVVGVSFTDKTGKGAYVPLTHNYLGAPEQLNKEAVLKALAPLLQDKKKIVVGQNLKYDMKVLWNEGVDITANLRDTMLESYVLNASGSRHNMDALAEKYLNRGTIKFEEIAGKGKNQLTFNQIHLDKAYPYAAEDADVTLQLDEVIGGDLKKSKQLMHVFENIEMPLVRILAKMEYYGVLLDVKKLHAQSESLQKQMHTIADQIFEIAGEEFNIASTKQLQEVLYDKLKLPIIKKTPKGAPSTAEPVLEELSADYPMPKLILQYRSLSKLKSTYTDALPNQINPKTGRVHTSYNQAVTATGRLSSTDPNLQNIPIRTKEGRAVRDAFIAGPGKKIISADYSQIELRIMAHLSGDKGLLDAFAKGEDIHRATAAEVFGVTKDKVTDLQRRHAKAVNFGLIYGMSAFGLAKQINESRTAAQQYIDRYFARYPGVKQYMDNTRELASEQGFVETLCGRRLVLNDINAKNPMLRQAAERAAINAPMQGTAADIIKLAMIAMDKVIAEKKLPLTMIMQVHDELVFEVDESAVDDCKQIIKDTMEEAFKLDVPLIVEVGEGDNWGDAH